VEHFFYCRDRANTATLRVELAEAHWDFMDRYAAAMVARGPTLNADEMVMTGSMHIVTSLMLRRHRSLPMRSPIIEPASLARR
jgi:hypothetical protein